MSTKVLVNFIQDRSGSMQSVWDETLNGFTQFVESLRDGNQKDDVEYLFSLTTFDTLVETPIIAQPIDSVDTEELRKHGPRGSTALYDAVGTTIKNTDDNRHGASKIICVIVTDGQENSSREWDKSKLNSAIDSHIKAGDWTFTYLGTQPETWDEAGSIGIPIGATAGYVGHKAAATYTGVAHAVRSLSRSDQMGSSRLMAEHLSVEDEVAAGMKVDRSQASPTQIPPQPKQQKPAQASQPRTGRWR